MYYPTSTAVLQLRNTPTNQFYQLFLFLNSSHNPLIEKDDAESTQQLMATTPIFESWIHIQQPLKKIFHCFNFFFINNEKLFSLFKKMNELLFSFPFFFFKWLLQKPHHSKKMMKKIHHLRPTSQPFCYTHHVPHPHFFYPRSKSGYCVFQLQSRQFIILNASHHFKDMWIFFPLSHIFYNSPISFFYTAPFNVVTKKNHQSFYFLK